MWAVGMVKGLDSCLLKTDLNARGFSGGKQMIKFANACRRISGRRFSPPEK